MDALRDASLPRRIGWLASSARRLLDESLQASESLAEATGLSEPMVRWGALTTLETVRPDSLAALAADAYRSGAEPISSLSVVLAGNLFTATVRAVFVPLLLGIPVTVKASSRETLFPRMLRDALLHEDPELGRAVELIMFRGGDLEEEAALVAAAEVTSVYGADATIDEIARRHPQANLIVHGHGVSVAYCGRRSCTPDTIDETANALALDVAAYDQRGCLSPQIVYVAESRDGHDASALANRLSDALERLAHELPRGPLPLEVGAAQSQWRGLAEVEGHLLTGADYAVALRPPRPIRWSPGYRNITLSPVESIGAAIEETAALGSSLKCVGVNPASLGEFAQAIHETPSPAYVCALGTMQTPAFDALADGKPVWHGLLR